jgi:hypothetical protein
MRALTRFGLTGAFASLVAAMLWAAFGLSQTSGWIPRAVLAATLAFLLLQLALDWRSSRSAGNGAGGEPGRGAEGPSHRSVREWVALAWIGCLLLATWLLGVVFSGTLFCFAWLRWHAGERWAYSAAFAAVLGLALWLVFSLLLRADVYAGLLWGMLR